MRIERYNEVELIRQTLAGDTSAFDRLVKTHRAAVYVLVLSYTKNPADAEDLTQWIFMRAYERLSTLRELDRFLPWLQRITHNACKDWLRRQNDLTTGFDAMNDADFTETVPTPEEIALKREVEAIVREAIGALKETDRKLMEGRYIEGASYDQLQAESGLSYAAIANRLKRAKQQIRRRIEKLLGGMAILPGQTFIWGGIETVKLSVKTKLAAVGIVALIGIGGGVLYHQAFESNPVIVNKQGVETTVTEDSSTVEKSKPSQADIEAAIIALENLDMADRLNRKSENSSDEASSEMQLTNDDASGPITGDEKGIRAQIAELESQLTSYDSEIQRLDKLRYEYWDQASEYIQNQSDDSYRKIRELEAPLRTGEFSREEEMAIRAAVDQVIDEVNNEIKRLVESGNQASEQLAELEEQREAIRAELDSLKSLIGEE